jgi:hypothetical protein
VVQKTEKQAARARFFLEDAKGRRERAEGGPMERARARLGEVGVRDRSIARGGPGGAENRETSRRGSVFPGRCEGKAGEGGGGSNGGGLSKFG